LRTLVAADFNDARANFHLDGTLVELAIAGRPGFGQAQETMSRLRSLSKSLVIS
jgi:hypothetical protein